MARNPNGVCRVADGRAGPDKENGAVLIVPLDTISVRRGQPLNKMGQRALNRGEIFFGHVELPRGGIYCGGNPVGATGLAQIAELTDQLRGRADKRQVDNARVALAENGGGHIGSDAAAMVVTILEK